MKTISVRVTDQKKMSLKHICGSKVHIVWEGHKILQNLHRRFVLCSSGPIYGGGFAKFCGLLRLYELYKKIGSIFSFILQIRNIWLRITTSYPTPWTVTLSTMQCKDGFGWWIAGNHLIVSIIMTYCKPSQNINDRKSSPCAH